MSAPSSLATQFGLKKETTWAKPVTPDRFFKVIPGPMIQPDMATLKSNAVIAGYGYAETGQALPGLVKSAGPVQMELTDRSLGIIFEAIMGGVATTSLGGGLYQHVFTKGAIPSYTAQYTLPAIGGTAHPATATGAKVSTAQLACAVGEIATLSTDWTAKVVSLGTRTASDGATTNASTTVTSASGAAFTIEDEGKPISGTGIPTGTVIDRVNSATSATLSQAATATGTSITFTIGMATASASYASGEVPMTYRAGGLTLGGTAAKVNNATINWDNGLKVDRDFLGSQYIDEQLEALLRSATASFTAEFDDLTHYKLYRRGVDTAVSLVFTVGTYSLTIAGNARITNATQAASGIGLLEKTIECEFMRTADGADSTAMSLTYINGDSTP